MPKSSIDRCVPSSPRRRNVACVVLVSSIAADSVISQVSSDGWILCACSASVMRSTMSSWRIWCADRLIATRMRTPFSRHWRLCRQASSITQLPIAPIRPKRSAIGMKVLGSEHAARRVLPAQQRLDRGHLAALGVDLRLVEELELLGGDGLPQVAQELELRLGVGVHRARVEAVLRAARALRRVHRRVGAGDQLGVAAAVGVHGDADRARDHDLAALGLVRLREALDQAVGDVGDALLRRHVAEQEQELVAADAGDDVLAARHRLQALADLLEDEVADRVAVGVVDRLEAVEVDEQQGEPAARWRRPWSRRRRGGPRSRRASAAASGCRPSARR